MFNLHGKFKVLCTIILTISTVFAHDIELRRETSLPLSNCRTTEAVSNYPLAQAFIDNVAKKIMKANPEIFHSDLDPSHICLSVDPVKSQRAWATTDERKISIDAGLLLRVKNEAQIALTISHELAHLALRHTPLEGNPIPLNDREQVNQLLLRKEEALNQLLAVGKGPLNAIYQERIRGIEHTINEVFKIYFDDETIANWTETEADVTGAHYYLNTGYPSVELAWRHEQLVLALHTAGINPIQNLGGNNFDPHGPPSAHSSQERASLALQACRLNTLNPMAPLRGTNRYPMPCWQIWNLKIDLPAREISYSQLYNRDAGTVIEEDAPSLQQVKTELCAREKTAMAVYCTSQE
jgi:hypothetical protein